MSTTTRVILHVDMDAFYVSAELRRRPELRGLPVVVGGTGDRGVVAASSYEARRYGVFSAMSSAAARRLCPQAVFLPGDHEMYAHLSEQVHERFAAITPIVEPLALDEAFLDVTGVLRLHGANGRAIAQRIRTTIRDDLQLECSVGVAASKFVAKVASKAAKPVATPAGVRPGPGVVEVRAGEETAFLHPLPVRALWGAGSATIERLNRLGVRTIGDVVALGERALVAALGTAHGRHLAQLAAGIDDRPVEPDRAVKSIGHEETFARDLHGAAEVHVELVRLADAVAARLRSHARGARTLTLKIRFSDFTTLTRSVTLPGAVDTAPAILGHVGALLHRLELSRPVRLVGASASHLGVVAEQLSFGSLLGDDTPAPDPRWADASQAVDEIRSRFGGDAIGPATAIGDDGPRTVRRGDQQWGPNRPG